MELSGSPSTSLGYDTEVKHAGHSKASSKPAASRIPPGHTAEPGRARLLPEQEAELLQEPEQTAETERQSLRDFFGETESSRFSRTQTPFSIYRAYTPFETPGPSEPAEPQGPCKPGLEPSPGRTPARHRGLRTPQDELFSQSTILIAPSLTTRQPPRRPSVPPLSGRLGVPRRHWREPGWPWGRLCASSRVCTEAAAAQPGSGLGLREDKRTGQVLSPSPALPLIVCRHFSLQPLVGRRLLQARDWTII